MSENTPVDVVAEVAKTGRSFAELAKSILSPVISRWETAAELHEIDKMIAFAASHPEIEFVIHEDGSPGFVTSKEQELVIRAGRRLVAEAERKQINLEQVYLNAAKEIEDIDAKPKGSIYEDWITRLNSIAQDICDPEMQFVWGKILAGEYKQPGSFSLRTLDTIRHISRREAELFEQIMPLVCERNNYFFICSNSELLEKNEISYSQIMLLDECGLINSAGAIQLKLFNNGENEDYFFNGKYIALLFNEEGREVSMGIYPLTSAGKELFKVLVHEPNCDYFCDLAESVFHNSRGQLVNIEIHEITGIQDNTINYNLACVRRFSKKGDINT